MPDLSPIQRDLQLLDVELRRLEVEYGMYFANRLARPPFETRKRVESLLKKWDKVRVGTTADRFRFNTFQARYAAFADLWDRALRAREEGRPSPLSRSQRERAGAAGEADASMYAVTLSDPLKERRKLKALYETLTRAREAAGEPPVPFEKFVELVRSEVRKIRARGNRSATFRIRLRDGKVSLTVRGLSGAGK